MKRGVSEPASALNVKWSLSVRRHVERETSSIDYVAVMSAARDAHQSRRYAIVHLPLLMTVTSRSFKRQRNETTFPSIHMSVSTVSPG